MCWLNICMSSLKKHLFRSSCSLDWAVCFPDAELCELVYIFWKLILCQLFHLQFSSHCEGWLNQAVQFPAVERLLSLSPICLGFFCFYFHYSCVCVSHSIVSVSFAVSLNDGSLPGSSVCGSLPGKNTGLPVVAILFSAIFPTQGSNRVLHCRQILP